MIYIGTVILKYWNFNNTDISKDIDNLQNTKYI